MMTRTVAAAIAAAVVVAPNPSSARSLKDDCTVRSIERDGDTLHVAVDVDRSAVNEPVRAMAANAPSVKIGDLRLTRIDDSSLGIEADVVVGGLAATLTAKLTISVADGSVHLDVAPDKLVFNAGKLTIHGVVVGVSGPADLPDLHWRLTGLRIAAVKEKWIEVNLDVASPRPRPCP